jgi:hypothetical protein
MTGKYHYHTSHPTTMWPITLNKRRMLNVIIQFFENEFAEDEITTTADMKVVYEDISDKFTITTITPVPGNSLEIKQTAEIVLTGYLRYISSICATADEHKTWVNMMKCERGASRTLIINEVLKCL